MKQDILENKCLVFFSNQNAKNNAFRTHTYVFLIHTEVIKIGFELNDFGFYLDFGEKK